MTSYHYTPFIVPLAVSAAFCVAMLFVAWRNRAEPVAPWFAATVLALLVWSVGYIFELMAVGLGAKIMWANLEYVATIVLPLVWLQVVLIYLRRSGLSRKLWLLFVALGGAILIGIFLNPDRLFRVAPSVVTSGSLSALHPDYGPIWSFGWIPFVYGLLLAAMLLVARRMLHAHSIHVRQSVALLVATILPLAGGTVYALGLSPWPNYNPAMPVISVSGVLMTYALFSCRIFDLAPLARDAVIDHLVDGVMVLDRRGRLMDRNPAAAMAFSELEKGCIGKPIADVFAARPDVLAVLEEAAQDLRGAEQGEGALHGVWELEVAGLSRSGESPKGAPQFFSLVVTPVLSGAGTPLGLAVVVRDVTLRVELLDEARRLATTDGLTSGFIHADISSSWPMPRSLAQFTAVCP